MHNSTVRLHEIGELPKYNTKETRRNQRGIRWKAEPNYQEHYAVFSILLSLHLSSVQIFSSAPCSQTPSVYVPPLLLETKFHTHMKTTGKTIVLEIFHSSRFQKADGKQNVMH
jgi:hypothetical protein